MPLFNQGWKQTIINTHVAVAGCGKLNDGFFRQVMLPKEIVSAGPGIRYAVFSGNSLDLKSDGRLIIEIRTRFIAEKKLSSQVKK